MTLEELYNFCERKDKIAIIHSGKLAGFKGQDNES